MSLLQNKREANLNSSFEKAQKTSTLDKLK